MPVRVVTSGEELGTVALAPVKLGGVWMGAAGVWVPMDMDEAAQISALTRSNVFVMAPDEAFGPYTGRGDAAMGLFGLLAAQPVSEEVREFELAGERYLLVNSYLPGGARVTFVRSLAEKPVEPDVLSARVESLLSRRPTLSPDGEPPGGLLGRSAAVRSVLEIVERVAPTEATVLVTGETGTGKELVARAIHEQSDRGEGPFVAVNCAALAEGLLESELFGHKRDAFTGAVRDWAGLFEAAGGGTILLDEIGDVSPGVQHRLLRVLQERELTPVGAVRPVQVDVRVVAATNCDLRAEMEAGRFRDDLYYRLNVVRIELPPLRARREDIPLITEAFYARVGRRPHVGCSPLAMRLMQAYSWPGNVRELLAVLERAHINAGESRIEAQHLPADVRDSRGQVGEFGERYRREAPAEDERAAIVTALAETGGARSAAADRLGMSRTTLWRKIREYGLEGHGEA